MSDTMKYSVIIYDKGSDEIRLAIRWLDLNLENNTQRCLWYRFGNVLKVNFRDEKDYIWFKLTWE